VNCLYHFTTAKYALDDLRNRRLKIAQFDDLNDPFELKSVNLCNPLHARAFDGNQHFEGYKAEVARHFGVLCFSEDKSDVLQWSHYADRHKGICLGFDVSGGQEKFGRVTYVIDRLPFPEKLDVDFSWKLLTTKSKDWGYEKEWRVFLELKDSVWNEDAGRMLYFADFGPELVLQEIIFGAASKTPVSDVLQAMGGYPETVRVSRMRLSCDRFELQEYPVDGLAAKRPVLELSPLKESQ
jgi:Protein of unknown function (DUF2971)